MKQYISYTFLFIFLFIDSLSMAQSKVPQNVESFADKLEPKNRILNLMEEGWRVWGCAPIYGPEGKVHVFFSRWVNDKKDFYEHEWTRTGQIVHAIADKPEGPYKVLEVVTEGTSNNTWDDTGVINPQIYKMDGKYVLLYTGAKNEDIKDQSVGMLTAPTLYGPWKRVSDTKPIVTTSKGEDEFDSYMCNNPALVKSTDGRYFLYYKGRSLSDLKIGKAKRKIGLAIADKLEGPYVKYEGNPVYSPSPKNCEDPYVWFEDGKYKMLMADKTVLERHAGIYLESFDGIYWSKPVKGYHSPMTLWGEKQRMETPILLMKNGKPDYLFNNRAGNENDIIYSGFVSKVKE